MNLMEIIQDKPQNMGRYLTEQPIKLFSFSIN